jgi:hypothetical protein
MQYQIISETSSQTIFGTESKKIVILAEDGNYYLISEAKPFEAKIFICDADGHVSEHCEILWAPDATSALKQFEIMSQEELQKARQYILK